MAKALLVAIAGAAGALSRYGIGVAVGVLAAAAGYVTGRAVA